MKKTIIIGLILILALALVGAALAWGPGFGPGFRPGFGRAFSGPANGVPPIPNLTAEQSAKIQALRDGFLKENESLQKDLDAKATKLGLEIRKVLTPEQLAQIPAFSKDGGFGPGTGFGPRGFGPPVGARGPFGRW